ncbi:MAG: hypothetical protein ACTIJ4_01580 [Halomonas sp.]|uniref:hypothetical protein n=1 Tax=Halomonas sp. TaxID=1486246 RepID=UPI003F9B084A
MAAKKPQATAQKPAAPAETATTSPTPVATQTAASTASKATAGGAETATAPMAPEKPAPPKPGTTGWVMATLKEGRWEDGKWKEPGAKVRMTTGTYNRLKQFGRVE